MSIEAAPQAELNAAELVEKLMFGDDAGVDAPAETSAQTTDTTPLETAAAPVAAPAPAPAEVDVNNPALTADNTVIHSKSGTYQIPFESLEKARDRAKLAETQLVAMQAEVEQLRQLQAQAQARVDAGEPLTDAQSAANTQAVQDAVANGADVSLFGDFSEEAMAKAVVTISERAVQRALEEQARAQNANSAKATHDNHILLAHADAFEIGQSKELRDWIAAQPSFARAGCEKVLAGGDAAQVVELLSAFKQATGRQTPAAPAAQASHSSADARAKAQQAIDGVPDPVPVSLTQIAGGTAPQSLYERMGKMDGAQRAEALMDMTPDQREAYYARNL